MKQYSGHFDWFEGLHRTCASRQGFYSDWRMWDHFRLHLTLNGRSNLPKNPAHWWCNLTSTQWQIVVSFYKHTFQHLDLDILKGRNVVDFLRKIQSGVECYGLLLRQFVLHILEFFLAFLMGLIFIYFNQLEAISFIFGLLNVTVIGWLWIISKGTNYKYFCQQARRLKQPRRQRQCQND